MLTDTKAEVVIATIMDIPSAWRQRHPLLINWLALIIMIGGGIGLAAGHLWLIGTEINNDPGVAPFWSMLILSSAWIWLSWYSRPMYKSGSWSSRKFDSIGMYVLLIGTFVLMQGWIFAEPHTFILGWAFVITWLRVFIDTPAGYKARW